MRHSIIAAMVSNTNYQFTIVFKNKNSDEQIKQFKFLSQRKTVEFLARVVERKENLVFVESLAQLYARIEFAAAGVLHRDHQMRWRQQLLKKQTGNESNIANFGTNNKQKTITNLFELDGIGMEKRHAVYDFPLTILIDLLRQNRRGRRN